MSPPASSNYPHLTDASAASAEQVPRLAEIALALLSDANTPSEQAEAAWLSRIGGVVDQYAERLGVSVGSRDDAVSLALAQWREYPPESDTRLHALARQAHLELVETLGIALALIGELEPMAARAFIWLQHPVGEARPTVGLLNTLCLRLGESNALIRLAEGNGERNGVLRLLPEERPLCERWLQVPLPLLLALSGYEGRWEGVSTDVAGLPLLSDSARSQAQRHAAGLIGDGSHALLLRSGQSLEARSAAVEVGLALGRQVAFIEGELLPGFGTWLWLRGRIPVLIRTLAPGERKRLPALPGYTGPVLIATGLEGSIEADGAVAQWRVPVPSAQERVALWRASLGEQADIGELARFHRHSAGRIVELGQAARSAALRAGTDPVGPVHVAQVARAGAGADLGALAELLPDDIPDQALVLAPVLRTALDGLLARCQVRDALVDDLGIASRARYRPGVRALLVGPSGTGKTLAASWIATHLALPLYRVDLASVTSKYIGETEKNLAELFARAEHAEVVLLFDEADSLFGKRTDVKDANDRFANQQTNYLLQRIESFEGITLLTSNSRARFDSAFTRRLDAIIEFPAPGPEERRALWRAHLGKQHRLSAAQLNRLAANCELAGGHIRNVVLAGAALALQHGRSLSEDDLLVALAAEYRKLGKPLPSGLNRRG